MRRQQAAIAALSTVAVWLLVSVSSALAISAPIHIAGTDGEGVFIRPDPSTANPAVGWMPEGASPDYNCFAWGQNIGGVPIWFNVNYGGKTGYYASYYDDSSYHSNEELTAKYGVPLCGSSPASSPSPAPSPSPSPGTPAPPAPPAPSGVPALYYSPYPTGSKYDLKDRVSKNIGSNEWSIGQCRLPNLPYVAGTAALSNGTPQVLAGWSLGRVGAISYLIDASVAQKLAIEYMILIDPGAYGEMSCDRTRDLGEYLVNWLEINSRAHLVVISGAGVTQDENSKGIQEVYFNPIRNADKAVGHRGGDLSSRVLTCNYTFKPSGGLTGHEEAYFASRYWIQHQIGSTRNACPWLSLSGTTYKPTAGWHPTN